MNGENKNLLINNKTSSQNLTSFSSSCIIPMSKLSNYDLYNQLGQGTFGIVTKAKQKKSGKLVAIKKFLVSDKKEGFPITAFREITIMKKLKNINILQIVDMINELESFHIVTPYISSDLNGLLNNPRIIINLSQIKCLMKQILNGINYVHQSGYLHRDIKTANILLDHFGIVKIADFGLARLYHGIPPSNENSLPGGGKFDYTGLVVTRWYRSPELLLGDRKYTTSVDMWGIGCVFGEFFTKKPILEGKSDIHQAELIFKLLGSPNSENFPNCHLINRNNINLKINFKRSLENNYSNLMNDDALNLFSGLLTLDPLKRFNAIKSLNSDFFKNDPLPCSIENLSNFEESHESDVKRFKEESKSIINDNNNITNNNLNTSFTNLNSLKNKTNESSLNHSKYGIDLPTYMNRDNSTNDFNSNQKVNSNDEAFPEKSNKLNRFPKNQLNQIQRQLQNSNSKNNKRKFEYDNNYDYNYGYDYVYNYQDDYNDYKQRRFDQNFGYEGRSDLNNQNKKINHGRSRYDYTNGKELYGANASGHSTGLSELTKVLMKKKQKLSQNDQSKDKEKDNDKDKNRE